MEEEPKKDVINDNKEDLTEAIMNAEGTSDEDKARAILATMEQEPKKSNKKLIALIIVVILIIIAAIAAVVMIDEMIDERDDDDVAVVSQKATKVSGTKINLSEYDNDVLIDAGGEYALSGKLAHGVIINTSEAVKLNLNGVNITNSSSAAIANIGTGTLEIVLVEGTENILADGGESEQDGCLFSASDLTISGEGTLLVYGRQNDGEGIATDNANLTINGGNIRVESADDGLNAGGNGGTITINDGNLYIKASGDGIDSNQNAVFNGGTVYVAGSAMGGDAGIDTDEGYVINGGTVIALGSDMLETPESSSKQETIAFNLDSAIASGTLVTLVDSEGEIIVSFEAMDAFRTLVVSTAKIGAIDDGQYFLYTGGTHTGKATNGLYGAGEFSGGTPVSVSGETAFSLTGTVTLIGQAMMMGGGEPGGMPPQDGWRR